jgi:hypothetical protein
MPSGAKPGERRGGRVAGVSLNKATKPVKIALEELARGYTQEALTALVEVCQGDNPAARVSAATALLDRGYGKPRQAVELGGVDGKPLGPMAVIYLPSNNR